MTFNHTIQILEWTIDALAQRYECHLDEIFDLMLESSQCSSEICAAMKGLDFEELALVAAIRPYEKLIERLAINHCGHECENSDDSLWDVTFSFETAEHAAMFEQAIQVHRS